MERNRKKNGKWWTPLDSDKQVLEIDFYALWTRHETPGMCEGSGWMAGVVCTGSRSSMINVEVSVRNRRKDVCGTPSARQAHRVTGRRESVYMRCHH